MLIRDAEQISYPHFTPGCMAFTEVCILVVFLGATNMTENQGQATDFYSRTKPGYFRWRNTRSKK